MFSFAALTNAASPDCSHYFWCESGVPDSLIKCGDGLLFDQTNEMCAFADEVQCAKGNNDQSPNSIPMQGPMAASSPTKRPTDQSRAWTGTPTVSESEGVSADPPWLSISRKESGSKAASSFGSLLIVVSFALLMHS